MQRISFFVIAFTSITNAQSTQRTKIAIVGLVHSHCWGFVTKLNQVEFRAVRWQQEQVPSIFLPGCDFSGTSGAARQGSVIQNNQARLG